MTASAVRRVPLVAVGLGVLTVLVASGLSAVVLVRHDRALAPGEVRLVVDGRVELKAPGGAWAPVEGRRALRAGETVRVREGKAVLELPEGDSAELRSGSTVAITGGSPAFRLEQGDLLVQARHAPVAIDGGSATASVGGAAKLHRSASLVAGVYDGSVRLSGAGQVLSVPRLRQAVVAGVGTLPDAVRPLGLKDDDEWDRRMLGDVLELDRRLVAFAHGFEASVFGAVADDPGFYRALLPALAGAPITSDFLATRSAGENLVGLALVALDRRDSIEARMTKVFGLRSEGARWGLIAADQRLEPAGVVDAIQAAIGRAPLNLAAPGPRSPGGRRGAAPAAPVAQPGPTSSAPGPSPTSTPPSGGGPSTTTSTAPLPLPSLPSTTTTTGPSLIGGLLDTLLGGGR